MLYRYKTERGAEVKKHYHLIGIGGIGMSSIAKLLLSQGAYVSGSDIKESYATVELERLGAKIYFSHSASNIKGADLVVYSSAIRDDNPEIKEAKARKIILIKRAQALAQLMSNKTVIAVSGSHGKTTTTSLASCLLMEAGLSPTVAIGGILKNIGDNTRFGSGDFFVAEADESDASFLYYNPKYSIITNIDYEHLDYYGSFQELLGAFGEFIDKTRSNSGEVFCCADDANLFSLAKSRNAKITYFGFGSGLDIYADNLNLSGGFSEFDCFWHGDSLGRFMLSVPGKHNISNSLSVIALGLTMGIDLKYIKSALSNYKGASRRMDIKFKDDSFTVMDDYAHHPTEIKATLAAIQSSKAGRVMAIFQPHRYSRTKLLLDEFGRSFDMADFLVVSDIYPASELPIEGVDAQAIVDKIKQYCPDKDVLYLPKDQIAEFIFNKARPNDLIVTLGAGDITKISDKIAHCFYNAKVINRVGEV